MGPVEECKALIMGKMCITMHTYLLEAMSEERLPLVFTRDKEEVVAKVTGFQLKCFHGD